MSEFDEAIIDDSETEEDVSLPFTLKVILFSLLVVAFILIVFSASVGAICRIQCKVTLEKCLFEFSDLFKMFRVSYLGGVLIYAHINPFPSGRTEG